ncbi:MAG: hypothetical protein ACOX4Z_01845 [Desulfobulbus sp.]|jgi:hypothetical protein
MSNESPLSSRSDKLKKAIAWVAEAMQDNPNQSRNKVLNEALFRYDLSPADCEFLLKHFSDTEK